MRAENYLQMMMDFGGDICYSRQQCLNHLFCVVGNGHEWVDGELVPINNDERFTRYKFTKDIIRAEPISLVVSIQKQKELTKKALCKIKGCKYQIDKWHPICREYSKICNYPDNIKPDWLALINEAKDLLKADGIEVTERNRGVHQSSKEEFEEDLVGN